MFKLTSCILYIYLLGISQFSTAHSGKTDASGCHTNRTTDEYHCHNSGRFSTPSNSPSTFGSNSDKESKTELLKKTQENTSFVNPSFDCTRATSSIEQSICEGGLLSEYDNIMGKMYRQLRTIKKVKQSQIEWLKKRNKQCLSGNSDCLVELYQSHLLELDQFYSANNRIGTYTLTGGGRELTAILSGSDLLEVTIEGMGGNDSTCDFSTTGNLTGNKAIFVNSEKTRVEITFYKRLIKISTQEFGICGVYGSADGLYLLADK